MVKKGENTRMRVNVPQLIWNFSFLHKTLKTILCLLLPNAYLIGRRQ
jgi:hypothetical protein